MDFKFEIDDEVGETEVGRVVCFNNTVDLLVNPTIYFDCAFLSIGHKRVFDENGMEDAHILSSIIITVSKEGRKNFKFITDRVSFYDAFKVQGLLFNSMRDSTLCGELTVISEFIAALRQFICDYCEQNDIAIFDE